MKNWVIFGLVALGCYFAYASWFASEEEPEQTDDQTTQAVVADVKPAPETEEVEPQRPPTLDLGEGPAAEAESETRQVDLSWKLHLERRKAEDEGRSNDAAKLAQKILSEFADSDAARWIHFERGREALQLYRTNRWKPEGLAKAQEARRELTHALFIANAEEAEKEALRQILAELAQVVLFSGRHIEGADRTYTPKRGAALELLCRKVFSQWEARVSPGFVADVNGLKSPNHLRAGEPLKVPLGEPRIVVVKSEFRLYFLHAGSYVRDFPVGLGKEDRTPEAHFAIELKQPNPDWYPKPGVRIPHGDPRNILGTRWLGFKNSQTYRGFGIHGTADPASIGKLESSGCIRMLRPDVERLYAWTPLGTVVEIRP